MSLKEPVYEKAKMGGSVGFGTRPVIMVIDFQKGFTSAESPIGGDMTKQVLSASRIIAAGREKNIKTIYMRVGYNKDGSDLAGFGMKIPLLRQFVRDHWYYDFDERLDIRQEDICIEKPRPSGFFGTQAPMLLAGWGIDTVILCGCTVAGCIYASAIDSCSYGYRTIIPRDAVADRSQDICDVFLWNAGQKYADVLEEAEVIAHIHGIDRLEYDRV